jgi:hypothetical protein
MTGLHMKHQPEKLWRCPACSRPFVHKPPTHACGRWTVADHFAGKPRAWVVFEALLHAARDCGPVKAVADKHHIVLHGHDHAFAEIEPDSGWLHGQLMLSSPRKPLHKFELHAPDEIDDRFCELLQQAYAGRH